MAITSKSDPNISKNFIKNQTKVMQQQITNTEEKHYLQNLSCEVNVHKIKMLLMFSIGSEEINFRFHFSPVTKLLGLQRPPVKQKLLKHS